MIFHIKESFWELFFIILTYRYLILVFIVGLIIGAIFFKKPTKQLFFNKYSKLFYLLLLVIYFIHIGIETSKDYVKECRDNEQIVQNFYFYDKVSGWNLYYIPNCFKNNIKFIKSTYNFAVNEKNKILKNNKKNEKLSILFIKGSLHFEKDYDGDWADKDMYFVYNELVTMYFVADTIDRSKFSNFYIGNKYKNKGFNILSEKLVIKEKPEVEIVVDYDNINLELFSFFRDKIYKDVNRTKYDEISYKLLNPKTNLTEIVVTFFDFGERLNIYFF